MLRVALSHSGHPTLLYDNRSLHSSYDPMREADRFIRRNLGDSHPDRVVIFGPGMGYLFSALRRLHPLARPIGIYMSEETCRLAKHKPDAAWSPGDQLSLPSFLEKHVGEFDLEGLKMLEWGPCTRLYPAMFREAAETFTQHLKELRGNMATSGILGRVWIRNTLLNFLGIDSVVCGDIIRDDRPTLIVASGPTIEKITSLISIASERINVVSLPSAVPFLLERGVIPDAVVLTDPGYYALAHINPARGLEIPLVMPLSAAMGSWRITDRVRLLSHAAFYETQLFSRCGLRPPEVPSLGTVAATALKLVQKISGRDIYICGLDLCYRDIQSHARPGLFDTLLQIKAERLDPYYSRLYRTAAATAPLKNGMSRTSLPLQTYAGWFRREGTSALRCTPSAIEIGGLTSIAEEELIERIRVLPATGGGIRTIVERSYPDRERRKTIIRSLLLDWMTLLDSRMDALQDSRVPSTIKHPPTFSLCYYLDLPRLTKLKRQLRLGRRSDAAETLHALLAGGREFLHGLLQKTE